MNQIYPLYMYVPSYLKLNNLESTVKFPNLLSAISSLSGCNGESTRFGKTICNCAITLPGLIKKLKNINYAELCREQKGIFAKKEFKWMKNRTLNSEPLRQHFVRYVCTHF